jgi:hypothetical protein
MKDKLLQLLNTIDLKHISTHIIKHESSLYEDILKSTSFIYSSKFTERIYCILHNISTPVQCTTCGNTVKFKNITKGYKLYCSPKCSQLSTQRVNKTKQTVLQKYGVDNISKIQSVQTKKINTCQTHYGTNYPAQANSVKQKIQNTFIRNYGVSHPNKLLEQRNKAVNTNILTYGVPYPIQLDAFKIKRQNTCNRIYGSDNYIQSKQHKEKFKKLFIDSLNTDECAPLFDVNEYKGVHHIYKFLCKKCNSEFLFNLYDGFKPICKKCNPPIKSAMQQELFEYVNNTLKIEAISNVRKPLDNKLEIDIFIPSMNIGFEFNGLYYHSEIAGQKHKQYHIEKTKLCEKYGIKLIHIFEDDWIYKNSIIKHRIRHILNKTKHKIYARKCNIKEIDSTVKNKFLSKYHLQGTDKSSIHIGAFIDNHLVAVMTFGKLRPSLGRHHIKDNYEMIRFCTIPHSTVIGISSKLLRYFERKYMPKYIITYANACWSTGNVYTIMGFSFKYLTQPGYWYLEKYKRKIHRFNFQKHTLKNKLNTFNESISEWENMKNNGYDRIWDCGNYVYEKYIK